MKRITEWLNESSYIAPISPGCEMCADGSKLVVLITGKCDTKCFYCPLSFEKGGKDRIFADEWELTNEKDTEKLIREAEYIEASGAGITGGDPLIVWKRTKKRFLPNPASASWHVEFSLPEKKGHLTVSLKQAIRTEDKVSILLLELTARGMGESTSKDAIREWFDLAHEWIVRGFTDLTTPEVHLIWEREKND